MNRLLVCAAVGCAAPLAAAFTQEGAARAGQSDPAPPQSPEGDEIFGRGMALELTLEAAIEIGLKHNLGLKIEALAADAAKYEVRAAWGTFDWVIQGRAGWSETESERTSEIAATNEDTQDLSLNLLKPFSTGGNLRMSFDTVNRKTNALFQQPTSTLDVLSVGYVQPLLRGAWREYATANQRAAEFIAKRAEEREREVRQQLVRDIADRYWDLVAARDELEVERSNVALANEQVQQNQRRLDAGMGTEVEVLQAQAEVATREEARLLAEVRLRQADDALKQLLFPGKDAARWETELSPSTPLPPIDTTVEPTDWRYALEIAIENRAELRQQRFLIDESTVRHTAARNLRHPQLDLDLGASSQGFSSDSQDAFDTAAGWDYPTYRAALVFSVPIGNRTARGNERAAWARLRAEKLRYDDLETTIAAEVREAVRQIAYQAEAVRAAEKSAELAERQLAAEEARYRAELTTNFQVLQFQQDVTRAKAAALRARSRHAKALVALRAAQGLLDPGREP